jgi:hypothetical protein
MQDFKLHPEVVEKIGPTRLNAKWKPAFKTRIAKTREEAIKMDEEDSAAVQVYTDRSGKDGLIGAAAMLYRNGRVKKRLRMLLGSEKDHTVPEAEGVGLMLGLELMRKESAVRRASAGLTG